MAHHITIIIIIIIIISLFYISGIRIRSKHTECICTELFILKIIANPVVKWL